MYVSVFFLMVKTLLQYKFLNCCLFLTTTRQWKAYPAILQGSMLEEENKEKVCVCGLKWPDQYGIVLSVQTAWWNPAQINILLIAYIHSAPRHTEKMVPWATGAELTTWLITSAGSLCFTIGNQDEAEWKLFVCVCVFLCRHLCTRWG